MTLTVQSSRQSYSTGIINMILLILKLVKLLDYKNASMCYNRHEHISIFYKSLYSSLLTMLALCPNGTKFPFVENITFMSAPVQ